MKFTSPLIPIFILCLNIFILTLPQISIPYLIVDELGYNEVYVSIMYGCGFIGGIIGLYFFGAYAEMTSYVHACKVCFICNLSGVILPIFFPENILVNTLSRGVVGTSAIIVVCQVWVSKINKDPIYMNYFAQSIAITLFTCLFVNTILDVTGIDMILMWRVVHIICACTSVCTLLFLHLNDFYEGETDEENTRDNPHNHVLLLRSLYFGVVESMKGILILYILSIDYDIRIVYLVIIMLIMNITNVLISPKLQVRMIETYKNKEMVNKVCACFSVIVFSVGIYVMSLEMYSGLGALILGNIFFTISFALTKSHINTHIEGSTKAIRIYLLIERAGMALGALALIPMYVNIHPLAVSGFIFILCGISYFKTP